MVTMKGLRENRKEKINDAATNTSDAAERGIEKTLVGVPLCREKKEKMGGIRDRPKV